MPQDSSNAGARAVGSPAQHAPGECPMTRGVSLGGLFGQQVDFDQRSAASGNAPIDVLARTTSFAVAATCTELTGWADCQLSFPAITSPACVSTLSTGSVSVSGTPKPARVGPMARIRTRFGTSPATTNP